MRTASVPSLRYVPRGGETEEVPLGKIIGVGRNYATHAREMDSEPPGQPVIFLKPPSSYLPDGGVVRIPSMTDRVDHEVELAVVIGRNAKDVPETRWKDCILGYGVLLDLTARDLQEAAKQRGEPWTLSKGFDTFTPISTIISKDRVQDVQDLELHLFVNGELKQKGTTKDMLFPVAKLIPFLSRVMTLERGDVIATGTPAGVAVIKRGDQLEARIPGLVNLKVRVDDRVEK